MSFKSIIQDMKGELGSISRKGFDVKFGHERRSRSHRVVQDSSVPIDAFRQSCWANMPTELLRDVLMRIEASEVTWPPRKSVAACAGVCRNWREIMKEIVKTPEISGNLTFPISLKQPGPRNSLLQCYIKRNCSNQTYYLYLGLNQSTTDDGKFLLMARKCRRPTCTDYIISLNGDDVSKGSSTYIGKLRSNFLGTKFTIYDSQPPNSGAKVTKSCSTRLTNVKQVSPRVPAGNYPVAHISGPRRMQCIMDAIPASSIEPGATNDDGKFLLMARKCRRPTCTDYIISLNGDDVSKGSSTYIGKLRSKFWGTKFTIYDSQPPNSGAKVTKSCSTRLTNVKQVSPRVPAGNYPVAHISYELNVLGSRGPRRMQCIMDAIPASSIEPGGVAPTQTEFLHSYLDTFPSLPFFRSKSTRAESFQSGPFSTQRDRMLVLRNKAPRWHEQLQCWCLNFNGRVTVASIKNFQLVASAENLAAGQEQHENVILQFGKVGKDVFTMDYQYPDLSFSDICHMP